jgi:eukaryotic-like serine/threonine-protein kinase
MPDPSPRPSPKRLADFEIIRRLGAGGMAEVFLAKKRGAEGTYKLLVVKRILPAHGSSRRFRAMFAEEAQLATRLNHPNIVQVYDFQDYGDEGQLLSMEYVEGPDLRKLMRGAQSKHQRIPPYVAAYIVSEVAKGLHYAHERKDERGLPLEIVHRDVSPQNILLSFEGAVKIADFGIATASLFREEVGILKGKTGYMSPEQARAERVDRRTDIYSLGVVFHELLTGRPLHGAAEGQELLEAVREGHVESPSLYARDIPPEVEAVVMRALSRRPEERPQNGRDLAAALTRVLFQKQQLIDSNVLEGVIGQLVSREHTSPGVDAISEAGSKGASAHAGAADGSRSQQGSAAGMEREALTGVGDGDKAAGERGREVRHVAVVTLRLHGLELLDAVLGAAQGARFVEQLKATLDEIAFKRGARWSWETRAAGARPAMGPPIATGRTTVGLLANPPRAAFDAAWLAVDVHEAISGACTDMDVEIQASVGIVRGIATGERDRAGHLVSHSLREPANYLAELLGEHAPAGVTWVAGGLYRIVRRDFVWGDAPTIQIVDALERNLPTNMRIYSLLRPLSKQEKLAELAAGPGDLIGRDAELADLHAAYHKAVLPGPKGGRGQVTARVVYGDMGIGKTALVNAFVTELPPEARVLRVECAPANSELPFASASEWVRELTGTRIEQPLEEAEQTIVSQLGEFLTPATREQLVRRLAELATGRVFRASDEAELAQNQRLIGIGIRRFFVSAAMESPLVIVVEGLQWCDRPSMELVANLIARTDALPILVALVTRPDERIAPYIAGMVRIELNGLSADNQLRLVQARLGVSGGVAQVCADLLPRAAGNPYFLLEMVDALLERGTLEIREQGEGAQQLVRVERPGDAHNALPSTLEQLIADRLAELPTEERAIVDWLAISGGPIASQDLSALCRSEIEDSVVRLCARGVCDFKGEHVEVRHPLTRDVAYLALERGSRLRMHRELGERLAQTQIAKGLGAAIVARHFAKGNDRGRAAELYLEAADSARSSYQLRLALRYYRRAVLLLGEDDPRRFDLHEALETIYRVQGRWRERRRHLVLLRQMARKAARPLWVATALLRTARFELDAGHLSRGLVSAQRAEQMSRQASSPNLEIQAQALIAEMLGELGDIRGALAAVDRALSIAGSADVPSRQRAEVLHARGTLLCRVGRVHEAVEDHAEAIAVFRNAGARRLEARAKNSLAFALFVLGKFEDAVALGLDSIRIDLSIGGRFQIAKTLSNIGQSYGRLGDLARGLAYLRRAMEAHERYGDRDSRADTLLCTAEVLIEFGDLPAADNLIRDAGALTAVTASAYDSVHEKLLRGLLARVQGDSASAVVHAFDARQTAEAQSYVAFHFYAMAIEAAARVDLGELHTGSLLATTAVGAMETVQGSEYGLDTYALCCEALEKARSPQLRAMARRGIQHVNQLLSSIGDPELRRLFVERAPVRRLLAFEQGEKQPTSDRSAE